jgi:hypothetical protein
VSWGGQVSFVEAALNFLSCGFRIFKTSGTRPAAH